MSGACSACCGPRLVVHTQQWLRNPTNEYPVRLRVSFDFVCWAAKYLYFNETWTRLCGHDVGGASKDQPQYESCVRRWPFEEDSKRGGSYGYTRWRRRYEVLTDRMDAEAPEFKPGAWSRCDDKVLHRSSLWWRSSSRSFAPELDYYLWSLG